MNDNTSIYRVTGTAGSDIAGAPRLRFDLLVVASTGKVGGHVSITQALPLHDGNINVAVSGQVRGAGLTPISQLVTFTGTYQHPLPPPSLAILTEQFDAYFAIDGKWTGRGGFSYGGHEVNDVPVRPE